MSTRIDTLMSGVPIMAIFRNMPADQAVELANRSWDLGIELVEVPIQTPDAVASLHAVVAAGRDRAKSVGSGTIITIEQVEASHRAGVGFTVSPGFDADVLAACEKYDLPHLPGVSTPTEVQRAVKAGCTWLKAFPAVVLGPAWFTTVRGPFPQVSFVATGGISASNAAQFLDAGVKTVAVGSALADPAQVDRLAELIRTRSTEGGSSRAL